MQRNVGRRRFLAGASAGGLGLGMLATAPVSAEPGPSAVLNFLLNLEYLQAEFYSRAVTGAGLPDELVRGLGMPGAVTGGRAVAFQDRMLDTFAHAFTFDERGHVEFFRDALGQGAVAQPAIDFDAGFTALMSAAGLIAPGQTFDAFADDRNFLLAAFTIEDVGVTAYKGAIPLLAERSYVNAAAGLLGVEAYQAGYIRSAVFAAGLQQSADAIVAARGALSGGNDEGFDIGGAISFAPADEHAMVFGRTPGQVLNVLYASPGVASAGGFFPAGVNGELTASA